MVTLTAFATGLSEVVELTIRGRPLHAQARLRNISSVGNGIPKTLRAPVVRKNVLAPSTRRNLAMPSKAIQAGIFLRDNYFCRYCNQSVVALPVMDAISAIYPTVYRLHSHWKATETDVSFWIDMASVDHITPLTRGGTNAETNLATSCWRCNELKGSSLLSEIEWTLHQPQVEAWDGLSSKLTALVLLLPEQRLYYQQWIKAFTTASANSPSGPYSR